MLTPQGIAFLLKRLTQLTTLSCWDIAVDQDCLALIGRLQLLQHLTIDRCALVRDEGLKFLLNLTRLQTLSLCGCDITEKGVLQLTALTSLEELNIFDTKVTSISKKGFGLCKVNYYLHTVPRNTQYPQ